MVKLCYVHFTSVIKKNLKKCNYEKDSAKATEKG